VERVQELVHLIKLLILTMQKRRTEILSRHPDEGDSDQSVSVQQELEFEDDICNEIAELVGSIVKNHPQFFSPKFSGNLSCRNGHATKKSRTIRTTICPLCF